MDDGGSGIEDRDDARRGHIRHLLDSISTCGRLPDDIARIVERHVIGQGEAVRRMSVLIRGHILRMQEAIEDETVLRLPRHHGETAPVLLIGPSGVGKTLLIRRMAEVVGLPHVIEDATSQSSTGYVGRSVGDPLAQLLMRSAAEIGLARWGIVAVDEFDKIRSRNAHGGVDVGGEGVQRCLLSLLDGGTVQVEWPPGAGRGDRTWVQFDTRNLMVVLAGAFEGLKEVVASRLGAGKRRIGFGVSGDAANDVATHEVLSQVTPDDLVEFGFLPEVVGRIRHVIVMRRLTPSSLRRILMEASEGPLEILQRAARRERFQFVLTDALVDAIVREAISRGLGARSLHSILSRITARAFYEVPSRINPSAHVAHEVELDIDALHDGSYELVVARSREREAESGSASEAAA